MWLTAFGLLAAAHCSAYVRFGHHRTAQVAEEVGSPVTCVG
ncbi:MAG: hypothetical protein ACLTDR_02520 [Adlercreutzia equolifaciens]